MIFAILLSFPARTQVHHPVCAGVSPMPPSAAFVRRVRTVAAALVLPILCLAVTQLASAAEIAPSPRAVGAAAQLTATDLDTTLLDVLTANTALMNNLEDLS